MIKVLSDDSAAGTNVDVQLRRFPYPPYVDDRFILVIQQNLPFVILLSFIFLAMQIVKELVYEKEQKLKVFAILVFEICQSVYV